MTTILIGIDDTDNESSRGTGYLARLVASECQERGLRSLGVTRHQFLVDDRIPYTSHNSGACVAVVGEGGVDEVGFVFDFVAQRAAEGSDPGVCVAEAGSVTAEIVEYGQSATRRIVETDCALELAGSLGIQLRALGGSGCGVIGALGSVGLRVEGNDGRFIDLPGLRELPDRVEAEVFAHLGIRLAHQRRPRSPAPVDSHSYETLGWARPRLVEGQAVLFVEWSEERDVWIPIDRKKGHRPAEVV